MQVALQSIIGVRGRGKIESSRRPNWVWSLGGTEGKFQGCERAAKSSRKVRPRTEQETSEESHCSYQERKTIKYASNLSYTSISFWRGHFCGGWHWDWRQRPKEESGRARMEQAPRTKNITKFWNALSITLVAVRYFGPKSTLELRDLDELTAVVTTAIDTAMKKGVEAKVFVSKVNSLEDDHGHPKSG